MGVLQDLGGDIANINPFKKKDFGTVPDVNQGAVPQVAQPTGLPQGSAPQFFNPYRGDAAGYTGFAGGQIHGPAGPTAQQLSFMGPNGQTSANAFADPFAQAQLGNVQHLQGIASGAPNTSLAEQQARQVGAQNQAQAFGLANSDRGMGQTAAVRGAVQQGAQIGAQTQQAAANARMAEQLQATGQLGQVAGQGRQQGIDIASSNAGLGQQATLAGYQGGLQTALAQGQIDQDTAKTVYNAAQAAGMSQLQADTAFNQLKMQYAQLGVSSQQANQQAAVDLQKLIQAGALGQAGINAQEAQVQNGMIGGVLGAGGTIAAAAIRGPAAASPGTGIQKGVGTNTDSGSSASGQV